MFAGTCFYSVSVESIIGGHDVILVDGRIDKRLQMLHVLGHRIGLEIIVKEELLEVIHQSGRQILELQVASEPGQQEIGAHPILFGTFFGLGRVNVLFNEAQKGFTCLGTELILQPF